MLLMKNALHIEYATKPHGRELDKPNEDRLLVDRERGIFIVLDGVTRPHDEYEAAPYESAAGEVGDIFLKEVYTYICDHLSEHDPRKILENAVKIANEEIRRYRSKKNAADVAKEQLQQKADETKAKLQAEKEAWLELMN